MADQRVLWLELVTPGRKAPEALRQRFTRTVKGNTLELLPGFQSKVRVRNLCPSEDQTAVANVVVTCDIKLSVDSYPLFSCHYTLDDGCKPSHFAASNPTKATMACLKSLNHKRNWSGYEFFGIHRADVSAAMIAAFASADEFDVETVPDVADTELPVLPTVRKNGATISWGGCRSYGVPVLEPAYSKTVSSGKSYRLQPGYVGVRIVSELCREREVLCQVFRGPEGPQYSCYLADSLDTPPVQFRNPTLAMH